MSSESNITPLLAKSASRHFAGVSPNGPLVISVLAVSLVGLAMLVGSASLFASVFRGSIHDDQPRAVIEDLVAKHDTKIDEYQERFKQRYIFFKPPPPPPPKPVVRDEPPPPPPPPVDNTPKVPAVYQGPSIAWVIGDDVYFSMIVPTQTEKYFKVGVGEERNGVKVLSTEKMPRTIRVAHMGGEYDVKVFGDTMTPNSLFPIASSATPRPSITIPGFVPVPESGAAPAPEAGEVDTARATNPAGEMPGNDPDAEGKERVQPEPAPVSPDQRRDSASDRRRGRGGQRGDRPQRPEGDGTSPRQSASLSTVDLDPAHASVSRT